jgi:UDP-N-acetylmuramate dehydrogenase
MKTATPMLGPALRQELRRRVRGEVRFDEPLSGHTTWRVGGPADALVCPADAADLCEVVRFAHENGLPRLVLGAGSNLLVLDGGVRGIVLALEKGLRRIELSGDDVVAEGGARVGRLLTFCAVRGRAGLEFLADIPGTVGGAVYMNAGAMGSEIKDVATSIGLVLADGRAELVDAAAIPFRYRESGLPAGSIVARCALRTTAGDPAEIQARISAIRKKRRALQPAGPSAGSTFKNPPGDYAGRLIEAAGLKGRRVGDAVVSERHANFLLNAGNASAHDVLALIRIIQAEVRSRFGVSLELEVQVVGDP